VKKVVIEHHNLAAKLYRDWKTFSKGHWRFTARRSKKVRLDPELYNAFDTASQQFKPFVERHLKNLHRQLSGLVGEAIAKK
jgi:hypothetical protein